jgi:EAL domain-containing protein (putative c-di-GMP-specific phosphodiesterase class I)/NO-binding membrane sensor protein with MHYT domain
VTNPVDPFIAALAVGAAVLTCYGCLSAAIWVSRVRPRWPVRLLAGNTLALGLGLWSACTLEALALGAPVWPQLGFAGWIVPLALACAGQLCGLLFVAGREPDLPAIAGSAFSFAAAIAQTQWSTLEACGGLPDSGALRTWAAGCVLLAFAGFSLALLVAFDPSDTATRTRCAVRAALVSVPAIAILGLGAGMPLASRLGSAACCTETLLSARLLAVAIASLAAAALIIRELIALFQHRLEETTSRSRHDLAEAHARLQHIATHDPLTGLPNRNLVKAMSDSMRERLALENDLRRALAAGEFEVHYQPQISTRTGRILSVEALLRWRHPQKGLIGPSSFIPLAEQTGLIVPLDAWVLREACHQARSWLAQAGLNLRVAVNLSAMQFRGPDVLDTIVSAVNAAGLEPGTLEIELTESALMVDPDKAASALKLLRAMGVSIAIDDFGTGYSSLSYLRRLPIDRLKIDRSFIRDLPTSATDESIVRAIVSLAHSVGLQVIAEGVETAEQLERIRALGCNQWQGHYCCPPQPAAVLTERLTVP